MQLIAATSCSSLKLLANAHNEKTAIIKYEGWNFNSGNYLFTTDTK